MLIPNLSPDRFFAADQQQRMGELMDRWRLARDEGRVLAAEEQAELDALITTELEGAAARAAHLADKLGR